MVVEVASVIAELSRLPSLTGPAAADIFQREAWDAHGRNPGGDFETGWSRDGVTAWIQDLPGAVRVEFSLWQRDVDNDVLDDEDGLDLLYDEAEACIPEFSRQLGESFPDELTSAEFEDEEEEFIAVEGWALRERTVLVGAKQDDTDLPVLVVYSVR